MSVIRQSPEGLEVATPWYNEVYDNQVSASVFGSLDYSHISLLCYRALFHVDGSLNEMSCVVCFRLWYATQQWFACKQKRLGDCDGPLEIYQSEWSQVYGTIRSWFDFYVERKYGML
jgi:NAD-dependent SIR2 family protein deacetylase